MAMAFTMLIALVGVTTSAHAFFQNGQQQDQSFREYKGEVKGEDSNKPLVFATVAIEGTNISTITNSDGEFALKVPMEIADDVMGSNVLVSFLGYRTKTIPLVQFDKNGNNKIDLN